MRLDVLVALLGATAAFPAVAEDSIRCDGGIVSVGDSKLDLLGKCGLPTLQDSRDVWRSGPPYQSQAVATVETWTYDFGPNRFMSTVSLLGGRVIGVERGGYGYARDVVRVVPPLAVAHCEAADVFLGATKVDLLARCGEPLLVDYRLESRPLAVGIVPSARAGGAVTVQVEVWTYNFGPDRFSVRALIAEGRVVGTERGGYGYR
ncbi:MAG TPA: DUF2845 domain-containing protein [Anaeromyxobacter sp.]|nr:DUF2845 domain-containing protein [Anaeromyxobacter sp.]